MASNSQPATVKQSTSGQPGFDLKILSLDRKYYDGTAVSVSATNKNGAFDILVGHTNFFSLLTPGSVTINTGQKRLQIKADSGIVKVSNGVVTLFINI